MTKSLTVKRIETIRSSSSRREIPDGLLVGLYLMVQPSGAKSFAVRYRYAGQPRKLTLGAWPALGLEAARSLGAKALRAAQEGRDPAREKQEAKGAAKRQIVEEIRGRRDLFENIAREFVQRHAMKKTRATTWRETARILGLRPSPSDPSVLVDVGGDVMSAWRGRRIQDITRRDVNALLDTIHDRAPIMANRTLAAVRTLFNWTIARDILLTSPCASIACPAEETSRDRILCDDELRLVWNAAASVGGAYGSLVQLLALTGQRLGEVAGMRWSELDLEAKLWALSSSRTKNRRQHEVPLADSVVAILRGMPRIDGRVFTISRNFSRGRTKLDEAISAALPTGTKVPAPFVIHDLRRTVASGMARLGIQLPVIEKVLNHSSGSFRGIVGVYQRYDFYDEKRIALAAWAAHVEALVSGQQHVNVVPLHKTGA
jgi:integrase